MQKTNDFLSKTLLILTPILLASSIIGCTSVKEVLRPTTQYGDPEYGARCVKKSIECLVSGREDLQRLRDELETAIANNDQEGVERVRQTLLDQMESNGASQNDLQWIERARAQDLLDGINMKLALADCDKLHDDPVCMVRDR